MTVVNTEALRTYLNVNLSKLCDADAGKLTKYIMALLKKNKDLVELRSFLVDQLDVFLLKETTVFVDLLLEALKTQSYLNVENENTPVSSFVNSSVTDSSVTTSSKNGIPDVQKSKPEDDLKECPSDKTTTTTISDVASEMKHEKSRKTPSKRIKQNDSPPTVSEACSVSPSMSSECEKVDVVDPPPPKPFDKQIVDNSTNYIKRCSDYDERGYCLKGSYCAFAHGCDAIPLNMEDVSSLNFNVNPEDLPPFEETSHTQLGTRSVSPLPPLPTTSPPPLPPLPPPSMLDVALGVLEPYNPESPGMNTYYSTPLIGMSTLPLTGSGSSVYGRNEAFHSKPQRVRELIGVPTVVNSVSPRGGMKTDETESRVKRKGTFDFNRLGPPKKLAKIDTILELRKVPRHLNTISMLNSHFSKFGRIVNLEISFDNDPEAALVKFASPNEASNAYRSSVAIFNNRFIKVFYHRSNGTNPLTVEKIEKKENSSESILDKLGSPPASTHISKYASTHISKGNVSRTVFIQNHRERVFQNHLKGEGVKKDPKKHTNPFERELQLLRKKQGFLKDSIDHQKMILAKLMKSKNKKEAEYLKNIIEKISTKIGALKSELKTEVLKKKLDYNNKKPSNICRSEKELLDAEMDLYRQRNKVKREENTHTQTKQTDNLLSEVKELSEKQFGNVENIEDKNPYNLVTFSSRAEAEATHMNPDIVGDDDEDEDDEGARSWRR